jgi:hypothetical protein
MLSSFLYASPSFKLWIILPVMFYFPLTNIMPLEATPILYILISYNE